MKIIIVGVGQLGTLLINFFLAEGHDITVIDTSKEIIEDITDKYEVNGVCGNGATYSVLKKAGIDCCRLLVAVSGSDEFNLLCALTARQQGVPHTIARVRSEDFLPEQSYIRHKLGVDLLVNPEQETAATIVRQLRYPALLKVAPFGKGVVNLIELIVDENSKLAGIELKNLSKILKAKVLVCCSIRNDKAIICRGSFKIEAGDKLFVVASNKNLSLFLEELGLNQKPIRNVLIIGGGLIGFYLAQQLTENHIKTKLIEKDQARCQELSERLPDCEVVYGDSMDVDTLVAEGIKDVRAVVALTGEDEVNLVTSIFASSVGVEKIIAQISNISYASMLKAAKNSQTISPHYVCADRILRFTKDISNSTKDIKSLSQIAEGQVLAIEFELQPSFPKKDLPLKDIKLKDNILVSAIVRQGKNIEPNGDTCLLEGDSVVIVTTDHSIISLNDILA